MCFPYFIRPSYRRSSTLRRRLHGGAYFTSASFSLASALTAASVTGFGSGSQL
jgi:hypothetical protein